MQRTVVLSLRVTYNEEDGHDDRDEAALIEELTKWAEEIYDLPFDITDVEVTQVTEE